MGIVIGFVSGKGGTGKSTLCAGIAQALAAQQQKVLCVDCDLGLRGLDLSLGMDQALSFAEVARGEYPLEKAAVHPQYSGLSLLTAPVSLSQRVTDAEFGRLLDTARETFDFILLDGPSGLGEGFAQVAGASDRCILVSGWEPAAVRAAARTAQTLELLGKTDVRLLVNRVEPRLLSALGLTIDDVMDQVGLPLLGLVPEDPKPKINKKHAAWRIAQRLMGQSVTLTVR